MYSKTPPFQKAGYFTSRCNVCFRSFGLYFINSKRSVVFFLFFVVVYNFNFVSVHCNVMISLGIFGYLNSR